MRIDVDIRTRGTGNSNVRLDDKPEESNACAPGYSATIQAMRTLLRSNLCGVFSACLQISITTGSTCCSTC